MASKARARTIKSRTHANKQTDAAEAISEKQYFSASGVSASLPLKRG